MKAIGAGLPPSSIAVLDRFIPPPRRETMIQRTRAGGAEEKSEKFYGTRGIKMSDDELIEKVKSEAQNILNDIPENELILLVNKHSKNKKLKEETEFIKLHAEIFRECLKTIKDYVSIQDFLNNPYPDYLDEFKSEWEDENEDPEAAWTEAFQKECPGFEGDIRLLQRLAEKDDIVGILAKACLESYGDLLKEFKFAEDAI